MSLDGRFVAFDSLASNLVGGDTNTRSDAFVHDRDLDEDGIFDEPGAVRTTRVSVASNGGQGNHSSTFPTISADSRFVAFSSFARNLVPGDTNGQTDVFVHDRQTGQTHLVSLPSDGSQANHAAGLISSISFDGHTIALSSLASNLVPEDTNNTSDVFIATAARPVSPFINDPAGFNSAIGTPSITIDFDNIPGDRNITGTNISGAIFNTGNPSAPSAPLFVVAGAETVTPGGFAGVIDPATNKLLPTTGSHVLSPGGRELAPGPNPLVEDDSLRVTFAAPVAAVGFDLLFQELDCCSLVGVTVRGPLGEILYANPDVPTGVEGGGGAPGGSIFIGFVSGTANIQEIVVTESDNDTMFPDSNIGYDSFRIKANP
jgi:hypothetical protein